LFRRFFLSPQKQFAPGRTRSCTTRTRSSTARRTRPTTTPEVRDCVSARLPACARRTAGGGASSWRRNTSPTFLHQTSAPWLVLVGVVAQATTPSERRLSTSKRSILFTV
jgi:hypothetical protein